MTNTQEKLIIEKLKSIELKVWLNKEFDKLR